MARAKARDPAALTVSSKQLLADGTDEVFRQFVHDTLAFAARIQETRNRLGHVIGLSGSKYTVLIAIAYLQEREGGVGINGVAEHLHLSGAFVTIETNQLIEAGLVAKKVNQADRRRVLLSITPKARALLHKLTVVQRPVNDELFDFLSAAEFKTLRGIMARLVQSSERALQLFESAGAAKPKRARNGGRAAA